VLEHLLGNPENNQCFKKNIVQDIQKVLEKDFRQGIQLRYRKREYKIHLITRMIKVWLDWWMKRKGKRNILKSETRVGQDMW